MHITLMYKTSTREYYLVEVDGDQESIVESLGYEYYKALRKFHQIEREIHI